MVFLVPEVDFCGFEALEIRETEAQASEVPKAGLGAAPH